MKANKKTQQAILLAKTGFADLIKTHFEEEHGVQIGRFEAEELFDRAFKEIAPVIYNQALLDAKEYFQEHFQVLAEDIVQLEISSTQKR